VEPGVPCVPACHLVSVHLLCTDRDVNFDFDPLGLAATNDATSDGQTKPVDERMGQQQMAHRRI